jgi:hypothetical protein
VYRVLVGKAEGKLPLGRPRHRWENNIKGIFMKWDVLVQNGLSWLRILHEISVPVTERSWTINS